MIYLSREDLHGFGYSARVQWIVVPVGQALVSHFRDGMESLLSLLDLGSLLPL